MNVAVLGEAYIAILNSKRNRIDPLSVQSGNSELLPTDKHKVVLEHSYFFNRSYLSVACFYSSSFNISENITFLSDSIIFESIYQNIASRRDFGLEFRGTLKPVKSVVVSPYLKLYHVGLLAISGYEQQRRMSRDGIVLESSLSFSSYFRHELALSVMFNYSTKSISIQRNHINDMLYIISLDKKISKSLNIGISTAIPFKLRYSYDTYITDAIDYREYSEANIKMSRFPIWIKFKYSFGVGAKLSSIERPGAYEEKPQKVGF